MKLFFQDELLEVGCDEAGRGCLAGPVVAGAVILPKDFINLELNDSKQLTEKKRDKLRLIIEQEAIAWSVAFVEPEEIDEINILNASILAMHKAVEKLSVKPCFIAVDGNKFKPYLDIPHACCIKGDANYLSIAAASILAKTHRDEYMKKIDEMYPQYAWKKNKGYPTVAHRNAIREYGATEFHRKSFKLLPEQLKLDL
ncbi:ribonuclease HII [Weeksellaceae bacterium TAE3-ERU29]|nr:ribonuclease HII [Weeksellaceae bacterium TAE3-ERU29]